MQTVTQAPSSTIHPLLALNSLPADEVRSLASASLPLECVRQRAKADETDYVHFSESLQRSTTLYERMPDRVLPAIDEHYGDDVRTAAVLIRILAGGMAAMFLAVVGSGLYIWHKGLY